MASGRDGTIYLGSAVDLPKRVWEHGSGVVPGFTRRYGCKCLVWYEAHPSLESARLRERQMKDWRRAWKLRRIEALNPEWSDLYEQIASA
jgi:putative endonuclease